MFLGNISSGVSGWWQIALTKLLMQENICACFCLTTTFCLDKPFGQYDFALDEKTKKTWNQPFVSLIHKLALCI